MSRIPAPVAAEPSPFTDEDSARVRAQLDLLLASGQFRSSRRCQLLLQYITERTLCGETSQFKERTLGIAVFGREPNYDTNQDPVVRATAAEIRKKLAQYYQDPAHTNEVRISLLPGSYVPSFHFAETAVPQLQTIILPDAPPVRKRRWRVIAAATALVAAAMAIAYAKLPRSPLDQFWGRMISSNGVLFCVGQPAVFNLRSDAKQWDIWEKILKSPDAWPPPSQEAISPRDLVPMPDRYFAVGDAVSMVHLASFFESRKTTYFIRNSNLVSFDDLRDHPAILVGAFDNDWTLRFNSPLRFSFERRFNPTGGATESVHDRQRPNQSQWQLVDPWPDWNVSRDYAIISRLLDPSTDRMLVSVAGITQYGTVAASEFLTNPEYFSLAERQLPRDWPKKNLQIVLQVPVIHGASGRPEVLAVYTW